MEKGAVKMGLSRRSQLTRMEQGIAAETSRTLQALFSTIEQHDRYTGGHSERVAELATAVAHVLNLSHHEIELVSQAGLIHDIGKVGVPERVLNKRGPLTDDEFHLIRVHPVVGANILARSSSVARLMPIVLHHHERWDGNGYPSQIPGPAIPLGARIVFVADAFDAMTRERPYGALRTDDEALAELRANAGTQFDPDVVDAMHEVVHVVELAAVGA